MCNIFTLPKIVLMNVVITFSNVKLPYTFIENDTTYSKIIYLCIANPPRGCTAGRMTNEGQRKRRACERLHGKRFFDRVRHKEDEGRTNGKARVLVTNEPTLAGF